MKPYLKLDQAKKPVTYGSNKKLVKDVDNSP